MSDQCKTCGFIITITDDVIHVDSRERKCAICPECADKLSSKSMKTFFERPVDPVQKRKDKFEKLKLAKKSQA